MPPEPREQIATALTAMRVDLKSLEDRLYSWVQTEMQGFAEKWGVPITYIDLPVTCYRNHNDANKSCVLGEVKVHVTL
jgi:hypothetical protein